MLWLFIGIKLPLE